MNAEHCVFCGAIIPEGIMVCPVCEGKYQKLKHIDEIREAIEKAPTADVVEVVRCKNCKYRRKWEGEKSYYCGKDNVAILGNLRPNFYCGFGKRRKDNGNS